MIRIAAASVATIVACVFMPILAPGDQNHPPSSIIISAVAMMLAGWIYAYSKVRLVGLIQGVLMLVVGSYLLSISLPFFIKPPGMVDNAAAGTITFANLVIVVFGVLTLLAGIGVLFALAMDKCAKPK